MDKSQRIVLLLIISAVAIIATFFIPPIPQWPEYHQFADQRTYFGMANFLNVASNLLYIILGAYALRELSSSNKGAIFQRDVLPVTLFFVGLMLTGFGSGYYHLEPDNNTLVWDRLPMTIAFMSFFTYVIFTCIDKPWGKLLFLPLLIIGAASVLYWDYTESMGRGDLRFYGLIQFLPMVLVPLMLILFGRSLPRSRYLWGVVGLYAIAKIAESADAAIMNILFLSGHSIKHLVSAFTAIALLRAATTR
ncbi:MAG: ceramidase [Gammaproteobacteria bacterium]|nr:ceramidase [Gammaproteobacteria bacterium]